jgi:predicted acyl esterase
MRMKAFVAALLLAPLAGCLAGEDDGGAAPPPEGLVRVQDRFWQPYVVNGTWSHVLEPGPYALLPGVGQFVDVPVPSGNGLPTQRVHMGLFFPDIPGCDWAAANLPEECRVPVVADFGPYYGEAALGDVHATQPANRLGRFLIENLVPHGYAVAQVSVFGTGDSGGCMDLMGEVEQAGVQGAVRFLGEAPWSSGAVALTGRSYDGSTPWEAAMNGDPHLKTVIPISGLYGQFDLMWRNGSAEFRAPGVLWGLYYAFTYTGNDPAAEFAAAAVASDGEDVDPSRINTDPGRSMLQAQQIAENALCPETQAGGGLAAATYGYGSPIQGETIQYWEERSFRDEVLANYEGSVYFIHGLQDWNVDPHMAFPFYNELEAKGLEMKGLFGQWGHNYPDRLAEHGHVRWDWAQDLLEWLDHYLKGTGPKPQLHVEVEDNSGDWRIEPTWPPASEPQAIGLDAFLPNGDITIAGYSDPVVGTVRTPDADPAARDGVVLTHAPLSDTEDVRIAGQPTLHIAVTPQGPGGQVYAELRDGTNGTFLGRAIMDLRYHEGGTRVQQVTPGQAIVARMQFFPMDVVLPAGHTLELYLAPTGGDYLNSAVNTPVTLHADGTSVLTLPVIDPAPGQFFLPPAWEVREGGGQDSP